LALSRELRAGPEGWRRNGPRLDCRRWRHRGNSNVRRICEATRRRAKPFPTDRTRPWRFISALIRDASAP